MKLPIDKNSRQVHSILRKVTILMSRMETNALATIPIVAGLLFWAVCASFQDSLSTVVSQRVMGFLLISCPFLLFSIAAAVFVIRKEFILIEGKPARIIGILIMIGCWWIALVPFLVPIR